MTKKIINVNAPNDFINTGSAPNARDGDSLRSSFARINDAIDNIDANFTEVYALATGGALSVNGTIDIDIQGSVFGDDSSTIVNAANSNVNAAKLTAGAVEIAGSTISTTDSSTVIIDQATTVTSNLTVGGDIVPSSNLSSNLGSPTRKFHSIYVGTGSVYLGDVKLSIDSGKLSSSAGFDLTGSTVPVAGAADSAGSLVNGNKTVSLGADGTLTVPSPTSPVFTLMFAESNYVPTIGKPTLTLTGTPWELHGQYAYTTDGRVAPLALDNIFPVLINPGYTSGDAFTFDESIHGFPGYTLTVTLTDVVLPGGAGWTANIEMNDPPEYPSTVKSLGAIKLTANNNSLILGTAGEVIFPVTVDGQLFLSGSEIAGVENNSVALSSNTSVVINTYNPSPHTWAFGNNGSLAMPGDITQSYQDNTSCPPNVDTVVYTATGTNQNAVKLFVMVEGLTDGGGVNWDTQACDVIAVKGYNNNIVHVTTYGVTYSGAGAIATFDGQWNTTTNRIEITCRPAGSINSVVASVHAIEMTTND